MKIDKYIEIVSKRLQSGISREHSYRGDLEALIRELVEGVEITNEPANVTDCGNPDYVITKGKIPIGYIEAKDIGKDLNSKSYKEQFGRYKKALDNLIITDYIWFQFFQNGQLIHEIKIGEIEFPSSGGMSNGQGVIKPLPENYEKFENLLKDFCSHIGQTIKSSKKLAEMMAGKARLLQDILERAITSDEETQENTSLKGQYDTFKQILIHDLKPKGFADIYAQTLAYGMFAARLHDTTLDDFSRQEAAELIPKSNPFLRKLFGYVAGPDIDERIVRVVDNLAEVFRATNVDALLHNFGNSTQTNDPIIHFYETFLAKYDPKLRKARGVWYTPEPVVNFIVRAVDTILKTDFDLPQGLADISKTKIKLDTQTPDKRSTTGYKQIEKEVHKVQILDPATGTGTFLAEVVKFIYNKNFKAMQGAWSGYVEEHLIPRLNGFELLMASYAMAHLKLDMLLTETGYKKTTPSYGHPSKGGEHQRLNIYLTNSLEEHHKDTGTLFSNWLSTEANEANHIKRDTPVMCVIGNPPYSGESANKGDWIMDLMQDYKKEPGGKEKLKERNPKWINDDYVKFLRYGQHYIDKNGEGILAFINPHGFLDNPTFRGMRWNLLKTYDKIYILDLHGNSKKKEVCLDGSPDQNVFDIMQGVSINIFVKTGKKKVNQLGKIYHYDLFGKREFKYDFLWKKNLKTINYVELPNKAPNYFMVQKDFELEDDYNKGIILNKLFPVNNVGIVTSRDGFVVDDNKNVLIDRINSFFTLEKEELLKNYNLRENKTWKVDEVKVKAKQFISDDICSVTYRPFDNKYLYYNKNFIERSRNEVMQHFYKVDNVGLVIGRQGQVVGNMTWNLSYITSSITDFNLYYRGGGNLFPLYLYPDQKEDGIFTQKTRKPNLNEEIVHKIAEKLGLLFVPEKNSPPLEGCLKGGVAHIPNNSQTTPSQKPILYINNTPLKRNFVENLPYNPKLKQLAKDKRKEGILSEVLFWQQVHKGKFHKIDFDRQRIIGNFIVDFYIKTLGLIIEIDGSSHNGKEEYDASRQEYLENLGLKVYRINDIDVKKNLTKVMQDLENYVLSECALETTPSVGHPSKEGEFEGNSSEQTTNEGEFEGNSPEQTTNEGEFRDNSTNEEEFAPIDILDYIYAVLHSPTYRKKYKEFLKIDFPRVPYPKNKNTFWSLVKLGGNLRQIHLLESSRVENYITTYPKDGNNIITTKIAKKDWELVNTEKQLGRIWINEEQYFDNIPLTAWEFYIGGYQPAQKWLKDRKERELKFEDILHYQKIIVALFETDRIMKEIDTIEIE